MKSLKRITLLIILTLITTGCMKLEVTMDINKDKSMTFGMIQAIDKSLLEQSDEATILEEEDKKELEQNGFKVEPYKENDMEGYKITRIVDNIDTVSTEKDITSSLDITETESQKYLFTVKKGFFKNTYKAKFESVDENSINDELTPETDNTTDDTFDYSENDYTYDSETDDTYSDFDNSLEDFDYSTLMSGMELNMKVNLPYKAISNNATSVTNDGKTLTWDMLKLKDKNIEFEFEMYNIQNIIIGVAAIILVIIIIIVLITKKSKSKKQTQGNQQPNPIEESNINNTTNSTEVTNQQDVIENTNIQQAQTIPTTNNFTPVQNTTIQTPEINQNNNQNLTQNDITNPNSGLNQVQTNNNQDINPNNQIQPINTIVEPQITNNIELQPQNNLVTPNNVEENNQSTVGTNNLEQTITEIKETKIETPQILNSIELIKEKEQPTQTTQNNIAQSADIFSTNLNSQAQQTNTTVEPQIIKNIELQPQTNILNSNNTVENNQSTIEVNNLVQQQTIQNPIEQPINNISTNLNNQPQQNTTQDTINKNNPIFPE